MNLYTVVIRKSWYFCANSYFPMQPLIDLVTMSNLQILRARTCTIQIPHSTRVVAADLFIHFEEFLKLVNPPEMKLKLNLKLKFTT
jgi:hypothetical protein